MDKDRVPYLHVMSGGDQQPAVDAEHERELAHICYGLAVFAGLAAIVTLLAFRSGGLWAVGFFGAVTVVSAILFVYHDRRSDRG